MKTHYINNGAIGEIQSFTLRGIRERTATTNIGGLNKTHRVMRNMEAKERAENEMSKVLGMERRKERAEKQRNDYRAHRQAKKGI